MSTDRELLEMAAKAAGIAHEEWHEGCGDALVLSDPAATQIFWNPLASDADALRLAVKLEIHVQIGPLHAWASTPKDHAIEHMTGDPYAATRRAIVRAAAAIGEKM